MERRRSRRSGEKSNWAELLFNRKSQITRRYRALKDFRISCADSRYTFSYTTPVASVLVVDDEADGSDAVVRYLTKVGNAVRSVPNGREALLALTEDTPDVVILDLRMPEMDGITFLEVIRCYLRWSYLPVIVLTALPEGPTIIRAEQMGARHIFRKATFRLEDLARAVAECAKSSKSSHPGAQETPPLSEGRGHFA